MRRLDDLGSVQDGRKMSTDGQPVGGLDRPTCERPQRVRETAGETAPFLSIEALPERLRTKIAIDPATGCWIWQGADSGTGRGGGYGRVKWHGANIGAHIAVYRTLVGPIRRGLQLDHRCVNRLCCRPDHLKPVTQSTNMKLAHKRRRA